MQRQFADEHLAVVTELVETPTRRARRWTVVQRKPAVIIAAQTDEGEFLLVNQERVPLRRQIWETPAGQIDGTNQPNEEEIRATALRELREETGYELAEGGELVALGCYFSSPGFTDECGYCFLARGLTPVPNYKLDQNEGILECRAFSVMELSRMIANNEIRDANTLSICARMAARGLISLSPSL